MPFETLEIINFLIILSAFIFALKAYLRGSKDIKLSRLIHFVLIITTFVLLNLFFTNIEGLFFRAFFNTLEHLSILMASIFFVIMTWKIRYHPNLHK